MTLSLLKKTLLTGFACMALGCGPIALAADSAPSSVATTHAATVGSQCATNWESNACLSAVSASNLALASNYGATLQEHKQDAAAETLKQHCAAATAATQDSYPAYAMKSAFTECAGTISDIATKTGINPDLSHYQLLIGATMCLNKDPGCVAITNALKGYAGQK